MRARARADVYPVRAATSFGWQSVAQAGNGAERGIVRIDFSTASMSQTAAPAGGSNPGPLLMMAQPHHRTHLLSPSVATPASGPWLRLPDLRGDLTAVAGNSW
jgi:hypothetical protein